MCPTTPLLQSNMERETALPPSCPTPFIDWRNYFQLFRQTGQTGTDWSRLFKLNILHFSSSTKLPRQVGVRCHVGVMLVQCCLSAAVTNIYWLPWCLMSPPVNSSSRPSLLNIILFSGKIILRQRVSWERRCVTTARMRTEQNTTVQIIADYCLAGFWSELYPAPPPAWVLHRMSSDLIIMDIWSSHSHSTSTSTSDTANHKTILTSPHLTFTSANYILSSLNITNYLLRIWKLGQTFGLQEEKQNKASYCIVSCANS